MSRKFVFRAKTENATGAVYSLSRSKKRIWESHPLQQLIDETRERFKDRKLTPEERQKYYLE